VESAQGDSRWFEVRVVLKVKAADDSDAINRASAALRYGVEMAEGVYPVADFAARDTEDPIEQARRRIRS
jgi:hypothetical protein